MITGTASCRRRRQCFFAEQIVANTPHPSPAVTPSPAGEGYVNPTSEKKPLFTQIPRLIFSQKFGKLYFARFSKRN